MGVYCLRGEADHDLPTPHQPGLSSSGVAVELASATSVLLNLWGGPVEIYHLYGRPVTYW